jgi:hypothetical protein
MSKALVRRRGLFCRWAFGRVVEVILLCCLLWQLLLAVSHPAKAPLGQRVVDKEGYTGEDEDQAERDLVGHVAGESLTDKRS